MTERTTVGFNGLSPNAQGMIWMIISGLGFVLAHVVVRHFSFQLHPFVVTFFVMFFRHNCCLAVILASWAGAASNVAAPLAPCAIALHLDCCHEHVLRA